MAVFDVAQQRVCVRVVYDGVASAGKTSNLRQLAELFATQRTSELFSPAEMDGRTLFFDWLQIGAGMVCGFPLSCQVITVPGQLVLTPRRRHLLSTADVVVHVCDSEEQAVARALDGLALFDDVEKERGERLPLVVQANKQDQPGALSGPALLATLGRTGIPVVEAIASDGIGVVDTFVAAVRAVVRAVQAGVESGRVRVDVKPAETAAAVLERLSAEEVDPEWAIEMMLEEASNSFTFGDPFDDESGLVKKTARVSDVPATWRPERSVGPMPVLPTEHVPTGFVWPAHTGRAALRSLATSTEAKRPFALDGEGALQIVIGDFVLSTSRERRFDTPEGARQALVRAARERTQLGALLAPETVLVAQPAADESTWLWAVLPRMPTIASLVASREDAEIPRRTLLGAFGSAIVDALKIEALHATALDLSPRSFGMAHGAVRYLGDMHAFEGTPRDSGRAIEATLVALASLCDEPEPACAAIESAILSKLSDDDRAKLARSATWSDTATLPLSLRDARTRIKDALSRGRKAA